MDRLFLAEILRVDPSTGAVSTHRLEILDDDFTASIFETGTVWRLDGTALPAPPELWRAEVEIELLGDPAFLTAALWFEFDGADWVLPFGHAPEAITGVPSIHPTVQANGVGYNLYNVLPSPDRLLQTAVLLVSTAASGPPVLTVDTVEIFDDDGRIQLEGLSAEQGRAAMGLTLGGLASFDPGVSNAGAGDTQMVQVRVQYLGTDGLIRSFTAIKVTLANEVAYIPRTGSVDLATVDSILAEIVQPGTLDGKRWSQFGLAETAVEVELDEVSPPWQGTGFGERVDGRGGNDTMYGLGGADEVSGGADDDRLFGGLHNDTLYGGNQNDGLWGGLGDDVLQGGNGDDSLEGFQGRDLLDCDKGHDWGFGGDGGDTLLGGDGDDSLYAGRGNDLVDGGSGHDIIDGGSGADTLMDGAGRDSLEGGADADVFVLHADGDDDYVGDFEDGLDLFDLGMSFAQLTITTLVAGHVQIAYAGDVLDVFDPAGVLTAVDLTAADFI
jgi:hypothetical protein